VLTLAVLVSACAAQSPKAPRCRPEVGMTTEQLFACGCAPLDSGNARASAGRPSRADPSVLTIIAINYVCPAGKDGFTIVSVVNGVADQVFY
jgi:hypothetical protein